MLTVRSTIFFNKRDLLSHAYARASYRDATDVSPVNSFRYLNEELSPGASELDQERGELQRVF